MPDKRLFGTDGIRGIANSELSCETAFRVGSALATKLNERRNRSVVVVGKDPRISSDMLEAALIAGLTSCGCDVLPLGVIPTPAVSYLTRVHNADSGVMISASHNPYDSNGIKVFDGLGVKLSVSEESELETRIYDGGVTRRRRDEIGRVLSRPESAAQYTAHLINGYRGAFQNFRIALDCANGACSRIVAPLFQELGCTFTLLNHKPDGVNINDRCGSTDMEGLSAAVRDGDYDCGFAFDGDGDRCLAVDADGQLVDGDRLIAILALALQRAGMLPHNLVVTTVMANFGFMEAMRKCGIHVRTCDVGDRNVLEGMLTSGAVLGGEQSGHIIYLDKERTGDGMMTAILVLDAMARSGCSLAALSEVMHTLPQRMINVPVPNEKKAHIMRCEPVAAAVAAGEALLSGSGRVLVRPSGTEPFIRVMAEGHDDALVRRAVEDISAVISAAL